MSTSPTFSAPATPAGVTLCMNRNDDPAAPWFDPSRPVQQFKVDPMLLDLTTPGATYSYSTLGLDATGKPAVVPAVPILCVRAAIENVPGLPTIETYKQWLAARAPWAAVAVGGQDGISPLPVDGGFTPAEAAALAQDISANCPGVTSCSPVILTGPVGNTAISYSYPANDPRRVYQIVINGMPFDMGDNEGDTPTSGLFQARASGGIGWPGTWSFPDGIPVGMPSEPPKFSAESFSNYGTTTSTQVTPIPVVPLLPNQKVTQGLFGFSIETDPAPPPAQTNASILAQIKALLAQLESGQ